MKGQDRGEEVIEKRLFTGFLLGSDEMTRCSEMKDARYLFACFLSFRDFVVLWMGDGDMRCVGCVGRVSSLNIFLDVRFRQFLLMKEKSKNKEK